MRAGQLRNRVTLQRMGAGEDEIGQPVPANWIDVDTTWADIRHQSGLEAIKGDAQTSVVRASIRLRYRADIDAGMRVLHGTTVYDIKAVLPDVGKKQYVDLVCEVVA